MDALPPAPTLKAMNGEEGNFDHEVLYRTNIVLIKTDKK